MATNLDEAPEHLYATSTASSGVENAVWPGGKLAQSAEEHS
ncbi:hypothetical protein [Streptomyces poriticola]